MVGLLVVMLGSSAHSLPPCMMVGTCRKKGKLCLLLGANPAKKGKLCLLLGANPAKKGKLCLLLGANPAKKGEVCLLVCMGANAAKKGEVCQASVNRCKRASLKTRCIIFSQYTFI